MINISVGVNGDTMLDVRLDDTILLRLIILEFPSPDSRFYSYLLSPSWWCRVLASLRFISHCSRLCLHNSSRGVTSILIDECSCTCSRRRRRLLSERCQLFTRSLDVDNTNWHLITIDNVVLEGLRLDDPTHVICRPFSSVYTSTCSGRSLVSCHVDTVV
ncbi:hypothetical protein GCK72_003574 [Caenorhabditis remanei]|uniref:Uncharacterized protein n=1 Tax=Caenorhabditis remanei TaxID=31234 RepID=A0A6A5HXH8_CAERE|nr:hypothetical protein GCK72_003574 [Caenorhabditis remanei]KAF1771746.1 hypothetical protein GCK72_003574 [Caenorhabditis remanei]